MGLLLAFTPLFVWVLVGGLVALVVAVLGWLSTR